MKMKWKDLRLSRKLIIGFGSLIVLLVIISITALLGINKIFHETKHLTSHNDLAMEMLQREVDHLAWVNNLRDSLLNGKATKLDMEVDYHKCGFGKWYYGAARKAGEADLPEITKDLKEIEAPHKLLHESAQKIEEAMQKDRGKAHAIFTSETIPALNSVRERLASIVKISKENNVGAQKGMVAAIRTTQITVLLLGIVVVCLGIFLTVMFTRSLVHLLREALNAANKVAEGDLSVNVEVSRNDEFGQLFGALKNMIEKLRKMMNDLKLASDSVASASQQLSASTEQMTRGITEQSGRSDQIITSSNEMSQTITAIAKNALNIATSTTETAKIAKDGEGIVDKSMEEVKAIAVTVNESAKLMVSLGGRSKQIGAIVDVIKDIADQTNLLALNAAIEAARAGDQGRGFAVVADEVRKLAERTAKATSEIAGMIMSIQKEMDKAVLSMEEGTKRVGEGVEFSAQAGKALRKIVGSVIELQSMVQQIASATDEMSSTSEKITSDIVTIATISKETSLTSNQMAQSSSDLARLATNLQNTVGSFGRKDI